MLIQARQARTANTRAPLTQRSSFSAGQIRWYFGPNLVLWADAVRDQRATGASVTATPDQSGRGNTITQITATKQPLKATAGNVVACFQFDGVNDCLQVSSIDLTATQAVTVAIADWKANTTIGISYEFSTDINASILGFAAVPNSNGVGTYGWSMRGNAGFTYRVPGSDNATTWYGRATIFNKGAPAAQEMTVARDGQLITSFVDSASVENTNAFGNLASFIGSRNNGASTAYNGSISQVILLNTALSTDNNTLLSLLVRQAAGIP